MNSNLQRDFQRLREQGWRCIKNTSPHEWPETINLRYPWAPQAFRDASVEFEEVVSADQSCWLLTAREYMGESESLFAWNEWERQSIEAAGDDVDWIDQIQSFWSAHLPIFLSVKDGYAYFALREDGSVVAGREPEFEETTVVASNFERFITLLAGNTNSPPPSPRG